MGLEGMGMGMGLKGMELLGRPGLKRETWPVWSETEDNESSPITATRRGLVRGDRRPSCRVPRTSPPEGAARDRLSWNVHQEEGLAFASSSPAPANAVRGMRSGEAMGGWADARGSQQGVPRGAQRTFRYGRTTSSPARASTRGSTTVLSLTSYQPAVLASGTRLLSVCVKANGGVGQTRECTRHEHAVHTP